MRPGARWIRLAAIEIAALVFLLAAPRFLERGTLNDIWNVAFAVILASAWNLLGGFAGQVSIGYSAFIGIGAYTTVLLSLGGVNPYATLPLAALLAAAFSFVVGLPTFRLRGPYFTIATIGVSEAVRVVAAGVSFTGGSSGLRMPAGSFDFTRDYSAMVILAVAVVALSAWVKASPFGQALAAIRQDIDAAEALGVNSTKYKLLVHALSAALVAVAGGLFAINFQYISPGSVFDFRLSLSIVLMPIVGGLGTIAGPGPRGAPLRLPADQAAVEPRSAGFVPVHLRRDAHRRDALRAQGAARPVPALPQGGLTLLLETRARCRLTRFSRSRG